MYRVIERASNETPIYEWTEGVPVEEKAREQLHATASMPFIHHHMAVMPDVHWGAGSTIGSVIPTTRAIIPAAVGVDIGCGMMACRSNLTADKLPDNLFGLRSRIEAAIPHGRTDNGGPGDVGAWQDQPAGDVIDAWVGDQASIPEHSGLREGHARIVEDYPRIGAWGDPTRHLGTLGTGNHFIEVCLDEEDRVWIMLHSGSRGIGNRIGTHFIKLAKKDMERHFIRLPDKDLAYLIEGSEHFGGYVRAMNWAQSFAWDSREIMMGRAKWALEIEMGSLAATKWDPPGETAINCHHNYVQREHHYGKEVWLTRKGAVSAGTDEMGIIPGSMGAKSFIVRGKGCRESFRSCSHGAGRAMSRREARERFSVDDHEIATAGVECRKDEGVLDETPGAYKPIDAVMAAQTDLVEIVHTLHAVVCVKG